jgi:uncharacterized coiled-coil protein SlyX
MSRIAVVDIIHDSLGREVIPPNTRFYGDESLVMSRIVGSKARQRDLQIINDAEHAKNTLQAVREEKAAIAKRADAVTQAETLIRQLCDKVDTLTARMDSYEETQRAKSEEEERLRNAEPITLPPGSSRDELDEPEHPLLGPELSDTGDETHGELTIHPATRPAHREQLEASEDDDEGPGDLPPELTAKTPPNLGTDPALPGSREPTVRNPVGTNW